MLKLTPTATATTTTNATTTAANVARAAAKANIAAKAPTGPGVTQHATGQPIKGLAAETLLIKPTLKHAQYISQIKGHPGTGNCVHRFHKYAVGQTMLHCKQTAGLIWADVAFYATCGYLTIAQATPAQHAAMVAAWQAAQAPAPAQPAKAA
jgi:hypothetical protein